MDAGSRPGHGEKDIGKLLFCVLYLKIWEGPTSRGSMRWQRVSNASRVESSRLNGPNFTVPKPTTCLPLLPRLTYTVRSKGWKGGAFCAPSSGSVATS